MNVVYYVEPGRPLTTEEYAALRADYARREALWRERLAQAQARRRRVRRVLAMAGAVVLALVATVVAIAIGAAVL